MALRTINFSTNVTDNSAGGADTVLVADGVRFTIAATSPTWSASISNGQLFFSEGGTNGTFSITVTSTDGSALGFASMNYAVTGSPSSYQYNGATYFSTATLAFTSSLGNSTTTLSVGGGTFDNPYANAPSLSFYLADTPLLGQGSATANMTITLDSLTIESTGNTAPTLNHNTGLTLNEGATTTIGSAALDFNDAQQADTAITYTVTSAATNGTLYRSNVALGVNATFTQDDINNNRVSFVHNGGETTNASFGFSVSDGQGGSVANQSFSFTVTPVDDAPTMTLPASFTATEDTPISLRGISFADVDSSNAEMRVNAASGTFQLAVPRGDPDFPQGLNTNFGTLGAPIDVINRLLSSGYITYTPAANSTAAVALNVTIRTGSGLNVQTASGSVVINITPVNDAPVLTGDLAATVGEGSTVVLTTTDLGFSDLDDVAAGVTFTVSNVTHGTVRVNGLISTSFTGAQLAAGQVRFQHDDSETTTASFSVSVEDGNEDNSLPLAQTFRLTVNPVDDSIVTHTRGGNGGTGGIFGVGELGRGATGFSGEAGGDNFASGGGGAAGGGAGGSGTYLTPDAAGGYHAGPNGAGGDVVNEPNPSGTNGTGGGGQGGANGVTGPLITGNATGGLGGAGGGNGRGHGGGGGAGGFGAVVTATGSLSNAFTVTGGIGGRGGDGNYLDGASSGEGGTGGGGILFTQAGVTFANTGTITGGIGGGGGGGLFPRAGSNGGDGVTGHGLSIVNAGTIAGGAGGAGGGNQGYAVWFSSGTNSFEHRAGGIVSGVVLADGTADTFKLGGTTDGSFNASLIGNGAQFQGFEALATTGSATWTLTGTSTTTSGLTVGGTGTLLVDGSLINSAMTVANGATLGGHGTVGAVTVESGGTLAAGNSPGILHTGDLSFNAGAHLAVEIAGTASGHFDQVIVSGTVTLTGAILDISLLAFDPVPGDSFTIIDNDGTADLVVGTFHNLAEGALFVDGGTKFTISYAGGDGNDVVLQAYVEPKSLVVTSLGDVVDSTDGVTTLREAVAFANSNADASTITFDASLAGGTITLREGELVLSTNITIDGDNAGDDNKADITVSGNAVSRVFNVTGSAIAALDALTVSRGRSTEGGGIYVGENASLSITHTTISQNLTSGNGAGGGGIFVNGHLSISNSLVANNVASGNAGDGGGIYFSASSSGEVNNTTIFGNSADGHGGGIHVNSSVLAITNSTITNNIGSFGPGLWISMGSGGPSTLSVFNTIVLGNESYDVDVRDGGFTGDHNLIGLQYSTLQFGDNIPAEDVFAVVGLFGGGILADNGGPVWTVALNGSVTNPALDASGDTGTAADARGTAVFDIAGLDNNGTATSVRDLGAYELVNAAPTTSPVTLTAIAEDSGGRTITQLQLLVNATDTDTLKATGLALASGSAGTLVDNNNGTWTYTPAQNDDTGASFTYAITDGVNTVAGTASLDITPLNDAPAGAPTAVLAHGTEDVGYVVSATDLLKGFSDPDGPTLSIAGLAASDGSIADNGNGTWTITPTGDFNGVVTLTYGVTDGLETLANQTRTYSLDAVNDAPTIKASAVFFANEDTQAALTAIAFADVDAGSNSVKASFFVASGTFTAIAGGGVAVSGNGGGSLSLVGSIAHINAFIIGGGLGYTGAADATGSVTLNVGISDQGHAGSGGALTASSQSTISLWNINDAPSGTDGSVAVLEDGAVALKLTDFGFSDAKDNPANDLSFVVIKTLPGAGQLMLNNLAVVAGDSVSASDILAGNLVFTPAGNANGTAYASLTFQVRDNGMSEGGNVNLDQTPNTLTFAVNPVNDAPSGTSATISALEDTPRVLHAVDFGFTDATDNGANHLAAVKIVALPGAGSLTLNGVAVVTGQFVSAADLQAGKLVFLAGANAHGAGYASLGFQVQDDGGVANGGVNLDGSTKVLGIDVTSVNDAPTTSLVTLAAIAEDSGPRLITQTQLLGNAADADSGGLTATNLSIASGLGKLVDNHDGTWTFTPGADDDGGVSFGYTVTDGIAAATGSAALDITPVNDLPSGGVGPLGANVMLTPLKEDGTRLITQAQLLLGASDPDGDPLTAANLAIASGKGRLIDNHNGTWTFKGALNDDSAVAFRYAISDGTVRIGGTASLDLLPVNDKPVLTLTQSVFKLSEGASTAKAIAVASFAIADDKQGTNTLSLSGADAKLFQIVGHTLMLRAGVTLDFETNPALDVKLLLDDKSLGHGAEGTAAVHVTITDVVEANTIIGTPRPDGLVGTAITDLIYGLAGNDTLKGMGGDDRLYGGLGSDTLWGGAGKDIFVFTSLTDSAGGRSGGFINNITLGQASGQGERDIIADFVQGQDKIDLSAIDANSTLDGNQAFRFKDTGAFSHQAGDLIAKTYNAAGTAHDKTIVYGDVNGDGKADVQIEITGIVHFHQGDFVL